MYIELLLAKLLGLFVLASSWPSFNIPESGSKSYLVDDPTNVTATKVEPFEKVFNEVNKQMEKSNDGERESILRIFDNLYNILPTFPSDTIQVCINNTRRFIDVGVIGSTRRSKAIEGTKGILNRLKNFLKWFFGFFGITIFADKSPSNSEVKDKAENNNIQNEHKTNTSPLPPGSPKAVLEHLKKFHKDSTITEKLYIINEIRRLHKTADTQLDNELAKIAAKIKEDKEGDQFYQEVFKINDEQDPFP